MRGERLVENRFFLIYVSPFLNESSPEDMLLEEKKREKHRCENIDRLPLLCARTRNVLIRNRPETWFQDDAQPIEPQVQLSHFFLGRI